MEHRQQLAPLPAAGLALGCNKLGTMSASRARALVSAALDSGIRLFDTADAYSNGASERLLGAALRRCDPTPPEVCIATKGGYDFRPRGRVEHVVRRAIAPLAGRVRPTPPDALRPVGAYNDQEFSIERLQAAAAASRRRLGVSSLDVFQLHGPPPSVIERAPDLAASLQADGHIARVGVGLEDATDAERWLTTSGISVVQMPFGLIDPEGLAAVRSAEQRDVALMVRGIFAAGLLSERLSADQLRARTAKHEWIADLHRLARQHHTNALQLAAWYVRHRAPRAVWVVGCTSEHQLRLNVTMFSSPLPDPSLFDHCDALAAHHMPLVAGRP